MSTTSTSTVFHTNITIFKESLTHYISLTIFIGILFFNSANILIELSTEFFFAKMPNEIM